MGRLGGSKCAWISGGTPLIWGSCCYLMDFHDNGCVWIRSLETIIFLNSNVLDTDTLFRYVLEKRFARHNMLRRGSQTARWRDVQVLNMTFPNWGRTFLMSMNSDMQNQGSEQFSDSPKIGPDTHLSKVPTTH